MKPNVGEWTTVIPGSWNLAILNFDWVAREIFEQKDINVALAVGPGLPQVTFTAGNVSLRPTADRVIFSARDASDKALSTIESFATKLLEKLPQTPVSAVGVNFGFIEETPDADTLEMFKIVDTNKISDAGYVIRETSIIRSVLIDDVRVNFKSVNDNNGAVSFHFNFHNEAENAEDAMTALKGKTLIYKKKAEQFLLSIYGLINEEEDGYVEES